MWTKTWLSGLALAGIAVLAGCGQQTTGVPLASDAAALEETLGQRSDEGGYWPKSVQLGQNLTLGAVVLDGRGFTLYRFDKDSDSPPKSTCEGACARQWPPVLANEKITFENLSPSEIGVLDRRDGTQQVTIGGRPVYRYVKDIVPGQTNGQGAGRTWFAVAPDGSKAGQKAKSGN
ncbi:hypothetical protein [Kibdelosporangium aridum]|uniref:Secreted repeat protein with Y-X4-D motif n=1 Tax=Kibdelosporangium aridum TaxID=2030 RepID=A0A1Y5XB99_KIBAR|nr:hypothetical protein [Kibdelosporangium aridum]SMC83696.1 Secreted repeat of unknown function [Kibdelosporangium aridum]